MREDLALVDEQTERLVLGAAFYDARAWFESAYDLAPATFAPRGHQVVQEALRHHVESGKPLDLPAVAATLRDRGLAEAERILAECVDACGPLDAMRLAFYTSRVAQQAKLRDLRRLFARHGELVTDPELDYAEKLDTIAAETFAALEDRAGSRRAATCEQLADQFLADFDARDAAAERGETSTRIDTGFSDLDELTDGLRPGRSIVVAARSSHGKSTLCLDLVLRAGRAGHPALVAALEQTQLEVFLALLQKSAGIRPIEAREGLVERDRLERGMAEVRALPITIDARRYSLRELGALIRRARVVYGVELVVVDYVQLVANPLRGQSRATEVAGVTAELKRLALDLDVCIVAAAQLNKAPDLRDGGVPRLSDLRESEAIAHDADQVIFLVRPDLNGDGGEPFLVLAKNRHGGTRRRIALRFDTRTCTYLPVHVRAEAAA